MADTVEAVFRREAGRCVATLIRLLGDVDLAEDAVADAFTVALERWPVDGVPPNPGGWITTTARNRSIDRLRRESTRMDRYIAAHHLGDHDGRNDQESLDREDLDELVEIVPDDQLRLMFVCCHPALAPDAQVALMLRLLGGLSTVEIARSFLVTEQTMTQRIVRAKRKLRANHAAYRIPRDSELPDRLGVVLAAVSLIFNEGHTATAGNDLIRSELCSEAIRLGRVVVELMPDEPEAVGLLALMLLTEARQRARANHDGTMIRLAEQDRSLWDRQLIVEGHALVKACLRRNQPGPFQVQAAIAAVHADTTNSADTDWAQIVSLYDLLYEMKPNRVVALNRAIAIGERDDANSGLAALDEHGDDDLEGYQPYHAARADLLVRVGRIAAAVRSYDQALALTTNPIEREFLTAQKRTAEQLHGGHHRDSEPLAGGVKVRGDPAP